MPEAVDEYFYSKLPLHEISISELMADERNFVAVPEDWQIVIADIKNSTKAIREGRHQLVNLIATGSIVAGLNIAQKRTITIPYFFGGDGAALLVPASISEELMQALQAHRENTRRNFGLDLRVGNVPVAQVYRQGRSLRIAKVKIGEIRNMPVAIGFGIQYAENLVKGRDYGNHIAAENDSMLNLTGMNCRWDKIKPPEQIDEVVCLLVDAIEEDRHAEVYKKVFEAMDDIYGPHQKRKPISVSTLKLKAKPDGIYAETLMILGKFKPWYLFKNWMITLFGFLYFKFYKSGKKYLWELVELSDTLIVDGRISTIIAGTARQRILLTEALDQLEAEGDIVYGFQVSSESIISCYVRENIEHRVHFVDGSDEGYTGAAAMLKGKAVNRAN